ncbi:MAG: hypothetical protein ACRDMH_07240 [Solirubrobacterales bacterium]
MGATDEAAGLHPELHASALREDGGAGAPVEAAAIQLAGLGWSSQQQPSDEDAGQDELPAETHGLPDREVKRRAENVAVLPPPDGVRAGALQDAGKVALQVKHADKRLAALLEGQPVGTVRFEAAEVPEAQLVNARDSAGLLQPKLQPSVL